jgi:hypothetical protein
MLASLRRHGSSSGSGGGSRLLHASIRWCEQNSANLKLAPPLQLLPQQKKSQQAGASRLMF